MRRPTTAAPPSHIPGHSRVRRFTTWKVASTASAATSVIFGSSRTTQRTRRFCATTFGKTLRRRSLPKKLFSRCSLAPTFALSQRRHSLLYYDRLFMFLHTPHDFCPESAFTDRWISLVAYNILMHFVIHAQTMNLFAWYL